jgi:diguanylate cyclase (GGDEF)-like protein/PAS domain S-box-containing protein
MLNLEDPQLLRAILDNLQTGLFVTDREHRIVFWNDGAEKITGYMRHAVLGHLCRGTADSRHDRKICPFCGTGNAPDKTLSDGVVVDCQIYLQHKAGYTLPVHARSVPIRDSHGSVVGVLRIFEEQQTMITKARKNLASHGCLDALSGVPNHRFTEFHLRESMLSYVEYNLPFGILCIAIEEIVRIRDTYGQEAALAMLHMVAQTATHVLGPTAFLGRWGENEFIGILLNCDRSELETQAAEVQRVGSSSHITWWDDRISPRVVVTKAMVRPGDTLNSLLERAESRFERDPWAGSNSHASPPAQQTDKG